METFWATFISHLVCQNLSSIQFKRNCLIVILLNLAIEIFFHVRLKSIWCFSCEIDWISEKLKETIPCSSANHASICVICVRGSSIVYVLFQKVCTTPLFNVMHANLHREDEFQVVDFNSKIVELVVY